MVLLIIFRQFRACSGILTTTGSVLIHTYTSVKIFFPCQVAGYILIFRTTPSSIIKIMSVSFLMSVIFSLFFSRKQRKSGVSDPFILNLRTKCKRVVNFIPRSLIRKNHCFSMIRKLCGLVSRSSGYDLEQTILLHLPGIETQLLTRPTLSLATVRQLCPGSLTLLCVNNKCFNQNHFNYMHHHHGFFILTLLLRFSLFFYLGL